MTRAPDTVGEIMTVEVVALSPADPVRTAVRAMVDHDIGSVVVVEAGRPRGMFTERDLTRRLLVDGRLLDRPLEEVMASPVTTVEPATPMHEAFDLMNARNVRRLPVVEGERLVGIVTERDLLRWVSAVGRE